MLRTPRRYRFFLVFSIIFALAFLNFIRSRNWSDSTQPITKVPEVKIPPPNRNGDSSSSHGFSHDPPSFSDDDIRTFPDDSDYSRIEAPKPADAQSGLKRPPVNNNDNNNNNKDSTIADTDDSPVRRPGSDKPKANTATPVQNTVDSDKSDEPNSGTAAEGVAVSDEDDEEFGATGQGRLDIEAPVNNLQRPHWKKLPEHFPVAASDLIKLPSAQPKTLPKLQAIPKAESSTDSIKRTQRLAEIKAEFLHAWKGYKENALGHDEVRPVSGGFRDPFAGWGATLVDALDTLWIMGLKDEFAAAVDEVKQIDFTTSFRKDIPIFETVIRYLGGLIGAYDISGGNYPGLLDKAVELAEVLIGAFDTPNRMPVTYYYWAPDYVSQPHRAGTRVVMAELGSLSVEFTRLAQLTKEDKYYDAIAHITNALEVSQKETRLPGMWPLIMDASGCKKPGASSQLQASSSKGKTGGDLIKNNVKQAKATPGVNVPKTMEKRDGGLEVDAQPADYGTDTTLALTSTPFPKKECEEQGLASPPHSTSDRFGLGGQSDSTYEYLPKEYMLLGGVNDQYRRLYEISMKTVRDKLLFRPMIKEDRDIRFVATAEVSDHDEFGAGIKNTYEGTHLTCFAGGMFAVGAKLFGLEKDMDIAAKLTDGCVWAYESTATGIMPEAFEMLPCEDPVSCTWNETAYLEVMDPYEKSRISQAENLYQIQLKNAKETYQKLHQGKPSNGDIVRTPTIHGAEPKSEGKEKSSKIGKITKRDSADGYDEHSHLADVKSAEEKVDAASQSKPFDNLPGFEAPPRPAIVSHEDYVANRVKEERLPQGVTKIQSRNYILRPEAIESVFIMFRLTGDDYWREKGWKMFEAIIRQSRTDIAHSAISDVTSSAPALADSMESFWLAETLKYFYLLFSDPSVVSLDEYVL
ncbi:glycosyl hydrolase family 47-domain-containing protein [Talaromyces proteolyticus]|uniref:alpha-1,2-Mannosidase n=1 Tax=Talaromyces proteolyticus TaxID=1131652 RepID=A0AAD4KX11_9EURO|nr:glycosyl hydrolase family 47-domain-containing protein [Talaromyces proteolyticus]KAH8701860.1 glycosyl hydrolase family 47-domain-containing protein [Talaromyces proteolyticus]